MTAKDKIILIKITKYIKSALTYVQGMNYDDFMRDEKTMSATAFVIGQIGELARVISSEVQEASPEIPWKAIRGMRNRLIHDYENINMTILWETISHDLPVLSKQMEELIEANI